MTNAQQFMNILNGLLKDNGRDTLESLCHFFNILSIEEKQDIYKETDSLDNTLLMDSIEYFRPQLSLTLIKLGFDTNTPNINGITPLMNAIKYSQQDLALHLIDCTTDLDFARTVDGRSHTKKCGDTALIYAVTHDMLQVVTKLIEKGANPLYKNELGQSALSYSVSKKKHSLEIFEYLLPLYQEQSFENDLAGISLVEKIFHNGQKEHLDIIGTHLLEFPNLTPERIQILKDKTINTYRHSQRNDFSSYQELIGYWEKMRQMISIQNKFKNKPSSSIKVKAAKI